MELHITLQGRRGFAEQIYRQVKDAIMAGDLRAGEQLPSTRDLAKRLVISRNTVGAAYDRLVGEGFLACRAGAGTYVNTELDPARREESPAAEGVRPLAVWEEMREPPDMARRAELNFQPGYPDGRCFPFASWRAALAGVSRHSAAAYDVYGEPAGDLRLRTAIQRHVGVSRGVRAGVDQIIVTTGSTRAIDLISRVMVAAGDVVAVEDPGYPPARALFGALGARVVPVPVDGEGLRVEALPDEARLVYTTPSHQFPLGMAMSLPRRLALLDWARRRSAVIVEDDYDSEFRYSGRPIETLHSLDTAGRVVYVGTFSKVMLPTLRMGFLVAPPSLWSALRKAQFAIDMQPPLVTQAALAAFIERGLLTAHIRRMRRRYHRRFDLLHEILGRDFADVLEPIPSVAGMHLSAVLAPEHRDRALARAAAAVGVNVLPLSWFSLGEDTRNGLVLGFGLLTDDQLAEGLRRIRSLIPTGG
ncbi:PLP-dependent aminotransferase family protein [Actinokineospora sp. HUAS TT18]|uniref:MocR-like pyridoxine biosynthesis transcription factor PdxR n=1 Tax=Actinokineospora sp. HUAS TT18 TaxID=3447451 RepID=UPI003F525B46